ncbi:MAG: cytochrome c maturation protein CcmE [Fimbriimonadaceae bacterium]|nr:cytochrome c maturation protein CcmE [Fimbriimonadaceae bacterium]
MNKGAIVSIILGTLAMGGMVFAFLSQASPYVTIAEARSTQGDSLHVPGDIVKETFQQNVKDQTATFDIIDEKGDRVTVISQEVPANMGSATKVVAIGKMSGEVFHARKLLVKCPTKYKGEAKPDYSAGTPSVAQAASVTR